METAFRWRRMRGGTAYKPNPPRTRDAGPPSMAPATRARASTTPCRTIRRAPLPITALATRVPAGARRANAWPGHATQRFSRSPRRARCSLATNAGWQVAVLGFAFQSPTVRPSLVRTSAAIRRRATQPPACARDPPPASARPFAGAYLLGDDIPKRAAPARSACARRTRAVSRSSVFNTAAGILQTFRAGVGLWEEGPVDVVPRADGRRPDRLIARARRPIEASKGRIALRPYTRLPGASTSAPPLHSEKRVCL